LQLGAVEPRDRFLDDGCIVKLNEREPARLSRRAVDRKEHFLDVANLGKECLKLRLCSAEAEFTDKDLCRNNILL
jgi:hypothetical protein